MYAVIETGGKQYRVEVGTELQVELLEVEVGTEIALDRVLLVADGDEASIGRPTVPDATVRAEVVRRERGEKVVSFKYRPKARRRVKKGHRQELLVLRISDITLGEKSAAALVAKATDAKKTERARLEEAAARQAAEDAALAAKLAQKAEAAEATAQAAGGATKKTRGARPKAEVAVPEVATPEVDATEVDATEVATTEVATTEVDAAEVPSGDGPGGSPDATEADQGVDTPTPGRPSTKKDG
ncbi:MAG: 50S ribosomal protein L21 [Chloroflexota bacterium]